MPTIIDIATKLGVSKGTVSKALNNSNDISETLRKRVVEAAVEMGYEKNRVRKDRARKICVIVENMSYANESDFGYDIIMGFKKLALPAGWDVDIVEMSKNDQLALPYDMFMMQNEYKGSFILGFALKDPWMKDFKTSRMPTVLYDNYIPENPAVSYIGINNDEGVDLAVSYLQKLGHTRIGYLGGAMESYVTRNRYYAYFHSMAYHGLSVEDGMTGYSYHIAECTQKHLPVLLEKKVTAILCCHDALAHAVMNHCIELGYRIPEDISVIGFDDAPFSAYTTPPLTTIRQDRSALGRCGYYALSSLLNHTAISSLLLRAELIERKSTGRPMAKKA